MSQITLNRDVIFRVKEAREIALVDLDAAVAYETKHTLLHLIEQEHKIYPKR